jgi:hypothetical protein
MRDLVYLLQTLFPFQFRESESFKTFFVYLMFDFKINLYENPDLIVSDYDNATCSLGL